MLLLVGYAFAHLFIYSFIWGNAVVLLNSSNKLQEKAKNWHCMHSARLPCRVWHSPFTRQEKKERISRKKKRQFFLHSFQYRTDEHGAFILTEEKSEWAFGLQKAQMCYCCCVENKSTNYVILNSSKIKPHRSLFFIAFYSSTHFLPPDKTVILFEYISSLNNSAVYGKWQRNV